MTEVLTVEGNLDNRVQCVRRPRMLCNFARVTDEAITGVCPGIIAKGVRLVQPHGQGTR